MEKEYTTTNDPDCKTRHAKRRGRRSQQPVSQEKYEWRQNDISPDAQGGPTIFPTVSPPTYKEVVETAEVGSAGTSSGVGKLNLATFEDATPSYNPLEVFRGKKLWLETSDSSGLRMSMRIRDMITGRHLAYINRAFKKFAEISGVRNTYFVTDDIGGSVMVVQRPFYAIRPEIIIYLGDNESVKLGCARLNFSPLKTSYSLEVNGRKYAKLKSSVMHGRYEVFDKNESRWLATVNRRYLKFSSSAYELNFGEVESQDDLIGRALIVGTLVDVIVSAET